MGLNELFFDAYKCNIVSPRFVSEDAFFKRRSDGSNELKRRDVIRVTERSQVGFISQQHIPLEVGLSVKRSFTMGLASSVSRHKEDIKFPVLVKSIDSVKDHKIVVSTSGMLTSSDSATWRDLEEAEGIYHTKIGSGKNSEHLIFPPQLIAAIDQIEDKAKRSKTKFKPVQSEPCLTNLTATSLNISGNRAKCVARLPTQSKSTRAVTSDNAKYRRSGRKRVDRSDVMRSLDQRLDTAANKSRPKTANSAQNKRTPRQMPKQSLSIFTCVNPCNLNEEKEKFFKSDFTYNPQFQYSNPLAPSVLQRFNNPSSKYLNESIAILHRVLSRHGSYEKFEALTGGKLLTRTQIWNMVKAYLEKEGFYGEVVVNIGNDILSRAAMTINGGRPTLSIRESSGRQYWVEGLLRHEIGTHHLRFHNNRQQPWSNAKVRREMGLRPANPTEEGLASLHSVISRKDPALWRAAMLYYTAWKASQMSFVELFKDLGQFLQSPDVRWDYCLRTKRGQSDTSLKGCFAKDQVYLTGILSLLERRHVLDFHMLCRLGKVAFEDIDMLKVHANLENTKVPNFMKDMKEYRKRLDHIVEVNGLERFLKPQEND